MIDLTGPAGLFPLLGAVGRALAVVNDHRGATFPAAIAALEAAYAGQVRLVAPLLAPADSYPAAANSVVGALGNLASATLIAAVNADPARAIPVTTVAAAAAALVADMAVTGQTVRGNTTGATATPVGTPAGDADLVLSCRDGRGQLLPGVLAETLVATCTAAAGGSIPPGAEPVAVAGPPAAAGLDAAWPAGSATSITLHAVSPDRYNLDGAAGTLVVGGEFDAAFAGTGPTGWTVTAGLAQLARATPGGTLGPVYAGAGALAITGDGATLPSFQQAVRPLLLAAAEPLAVHCWAALCGTIPPATGALEIALVDGTTGAITVDAAGAPNAATFDLTSPAWTAAYAPRSAVFRTPPTLPAVLALRIRLTTALPAGTTLLLDRLALARLTPLYRGGPGLAVFAGAKPLGAGDAWTIGATNDRAGGWQTLLDRLFNLRGLGLTLPTAAAGQTPTIADPA